MSEATPLGPIRAVTITVPDLAPVERAYVDHLDCRVAARGQVDGRTAAGWGAPATAGCRYLVLLPETDDETCLRFIEDPEAGCVPPLTTHGWAATEITVRDTDSLAARLPAAAFRIIGAPANLGGFEWIRAMQVLGPADECLYFTDVGDDRELAAARCPVGQIFIVVAGGASLADMAAFYRVTFGNAVSSPVQVPIGVLNRALALPAGTRHPLALVTLPGGTRIELDEYPAAAAPRPIRPGHLPPGMSIVSFSATSFPDRGLLAPVAPGRIAPFVARKTACIVGAAGELIELCVAAGGEVFR